LQMFTARKKIIKEADAPVDAFEETVAQAIFDLQVQTDMKADLQDLFITSAKVWALRKSENRSAESLTHCCSQFRTLSYRGTSLLGFG